MTNEVFQDFQDPDGNFVEQFQSTGFDARIFELYLFAYLSRSGLEVSRTFSQPDFIVRKGDLAVAIEATTVNPTQKVDDPRELDIDQPLTVEQKLEKQRNELPIRFGGPLFSKLRMRYWELPHCRDIPLVFAIEAFHEKDSLQYSDNALSQYLYGLRPFPTWTESGQLVVDYTKIEIHQSGTKVIPSNFFGQPDAEHVSAVLFANSGTWPKFGRMGYQAGHHRGNVRMLRTGTCYNPDPDAGVPLLFSYDLEEPLWVETWGQGLVVLLNPKARCPLPRDYFPDAAQVYLLKDGRLAADTSRLHVFASRTAIIEIIDDELRPIEETGGLIGSILCSEFERLGVERNPMASIVGQETEWWADRERIVLGTVVRDRVDNDWLYVVLGRDERGRFRAVELEIDLESRAVARAKLKAALEKLRASRQTVFPQGD